MLQFNKKIILLSALTGALLLSGCGTSDTATELSSSVSGQLVDNYVQNVDYICGDGTQGITDANGSFECSSLPIEFKLAGLKLGQIDTMTSDRQIFPQDLVGVPRTETVNSEVVAMARFLQSCDEDNNTQNGIKIRDVIKEQFALEVEFNADDIDAYASDANITLIEENASIEHLEETTQLVQNIAEVEKIPSALRDALLTPASTLTQETKNALAYMGNEERLAYDVYNSLYNTHLTTGIEIKQLTNIATKSEAIHIQTVQLLVQKYITDVSDFTNVTLNNLANIDTNVIDMPSGQYSIEAIQNLYDTLIAKGVQSKQDALEVGCMVEVVDINDLNTDIQLAQDSNASDVVTAFEFLRDGSYSHYYSFDKGLKRMGVTEGCCVLGDEYCHPEYPSAHEDVTAAHDDAHAVRDEVHEDVAAAHDDAHAVKDETHEDVAAAHTVKL